MVIKNPASDDQPAGAPCKEFPELGLREPRLYPKSRDGEIDPWGSQGAAWSTDKSEFLQEHH